MCSARLTFDVNPPLSGDCKIAVDRDLYEGRVLMAEETARNMLRNEIETLDFMQTKIWSQVEAGDLKAIDQVLKIASKRVEWQDLAIKDTAGLDRSAHTVIIAGTDDYVNHLKAAATAAEADVSTQIESDKGVASSTTVVSQEES